MVVRSAVVVTAAGLVIGLLGTLAISRVMVSLVFRTSGLDPVVLGCSMAFLTAVAAIASYLPGFRATRVDPRVVLQSE
jgi:ABC-type antimicrobial peptide transport system permease subunit